MTGSVHAQTTQVKTNTAGSLGAGGSYVSGTAPGSADIAQFNSTITTAQTDTLGGNLTLGEIQVTNPGGPITIAGDTSASTLTLGGTVIVPGVNGLPGVYAGIDLSAATQNLTFGANGSANDAVTITSIQTWLIPRGRSLTFLGTAPFNYGSGGNGLTIAGGGTVNFNYGNTVAAISSSNAIFAIMGSTLAIDIQDVTNGHAATNVLGNSQWNSYGSTFDMNEANNSGVWKQTSGLLGVASGTTYFTITGTGTASGAQYVFIDVAGYVGGGLLSLPIANGSSWVAIEGSAQTLGFATYGLNDFAETGGNTNTSVTAATYVNDTWASSNNTTVTTNDAPASGSSTRTLRFNNAGAFTVTLSGTNTINYSGILMGSTVGVNNSTITGGNLTSDGNLNLINNDTTASGGSLIINSNMTDPGGELGGIGITAGQTTTANVPGSIQLGGTNTFSGPSYIDGGTVILTSPNAWNGQSQLNFGPNGSLSLGGTFDLNGNSITVAGLNTTLVGVSAILQNASSQNAVLTVSSSVNAAFNFSGTLQDGAGGGTLSLIQAGTDPLTLSGANTYTGGTAVQKGTLILATGGSLSSSTNLTLGSGTTSGIFQLGDVYNIVNYQQGAVSGAVNTTVASLSTSGTGTANQVVGGYSSVSILTVSNSGTDTYSGQLGGSATNQNNLALIKTGSGPLTLSGANTYNGGTTINSGTLVAGNGSAFGTGNVILNGGILSTDAGNPVVNVGGNFTQTAGTLLVNVNNPTQGASYNVLNVTGTAALGGTLEVNVAGYTGQTFTFVLTANAITGSFANVVNDQAGSTSISESVNAGNNTLTVTVSVFSPVSFSQWETSYNISSPATATPLNDGIPNLLKYLDDIDPTAPMSTADRAALPAVGTTTITGTPYLTLTFREYALETGITVNVQTSPDLQTWTTLTLTTTTPTPTTYTLQQVDTDSTTGDPIMQVQVPITGTKQFIRLNVTSP
jgi:autotransporter-associated beta strand protein